MAWGKGDHGKLGLGHTQSVHVPTTLPEPTNSALKFNKISSLSTHSLAVDADGEAWSWGNGDKFRLGHGHCKRVCLPKRVEGLLKVHVIDVACGLAHSLALSDRGEVWAWGNGGNGRLGLGDMQDCPKPTLVKTLAQESMNTVTRRVAAGAFHSVAVLEDGRCYSWGKGTNGQLGNGKHEDHLVPYQVDIEDWVISAAGGWEHTIFLCGNGSVYTTGCGYKDSRRGEPPAVLGTGAVGPCFKPVKVDINDSQDDTGACVVITQVCCGWDHCVVVGEAGGVWTWGSGSNGKLGHGGDDNCSNPTKITYFSNLGIKVSFAEAGCEHTAAVDEEGGLWTWGQGDSGRLGHGDSGAGESMPKKVKMVNAKVVGLAVGDKYNIIIVCSKDPSPSKDKDEKENCPKQKGKIISAGKFTMPWIRGNWTRPMLLRGNGLGLPLPRSNAAVAILCELERLGDVFLNSTVVELEDDTPWATSPPKLVALNATPNPVQTTSNNVTVTPGGYGDTYKYSKFSDKQLTELAALGRYDGEHIVSQGTRVPFVADASSRSFNVLLSLICDVLRGNVLNAATRAGDRYNNSVSTNSQGEKGENRQTSSYEDDYAQSRPRAMPTSPAPALDSPTTFTMSPPLTGAPSELDPVGFAEESADSVSMMELSNYILPQSVMPNANRESTAFMSTTAFLDEMPRAERRERCHEGFSGDTLGNTLEFDSIGAEKGEKIIADKEGLREYDEEAGGLWEALRKHFEEGEGEVFTNNWLKGQLKTAPFKSKPNAPPHAPGSTVELGDLMLSNCIPSAPELPNHLSKWSTLVSALTLIRVNLRHLLSHIHSRKRLMDDARRELVRRRGEAELEIKLNNFKDDEGVGKGNQDDYNNATFAPAAAKDGSGEDGAVLIDQNDESLQLAILNSLNNSGKEEVEAKGSEDGIGRATCLGLRINAKNDSASIRKVLEEIHVTLRWFMLTNRKDTRDRKGPPSVSDILGLNVDDLLSTDESESNANLALTSLRQRALDVMTEGFLLFYPTVWHRVLLLREIMNSSYFVGPTADFQGRDGRTFHPDFRRRLARDLCKAKYIHLMIDEATRGNSATREQIGAKSNERPGKQGDVQEENFYVVEGVDCKEISFDPNNGSANDAIGTWGTSDIKSILSKLLTSCVVEAEGRAGRVESGVWREDPESADLILIKSMHEHIVKHVIKAEGAERSGIDGETQKKALEEVLLKHATEMINSAKGTVESVREGLKEGNWKEMGEAMEGGYLSKVLEKFCWDVVNLRLANGGRGREGRGELQISLIPGTLKLVKCVDDLNARAFEICGDEEEFKIRWGWCVGLEKALVRLGAELACDMAEGTGGKEEEMEKEWRGWLNGSILFSHGWTNWKSSFGGGNESIAIERLRNTVEGWKETSRGGFLVEDDLEWGLDQRRVPDELYLSDSVALTPTLTRPSSRGSLEQGMEPGRISPGIMAEPGRFSPGMKGNILPSLSIPGDGELEAETFLEELINGTGRGRDMDKWCQEKITKEAKGETDNDETDGAIGNVMAILEPARRTLLAILIKSNPPLLQATLTKARLKPWAKEDIHESMLSPGSHTSASRGAAANFEILSWSSLVLGAWGTAESVIFNIACVLVSECDSLAEAMVKTKQTCERMVHNANCLMKGEKLVPVALCKGGKLTMERRDEIRTSGKAKEEWSNSGANKRLRRWVRHHPRCNWTLLQALCKAMFELQLGSGSATKKGESINEEGSIESGSVYHQVVATATQGMNQNQLQLQELVAFLVGGKGSKGHDFDVIIDVLKTRECKAVVRGVALDVMRAIMRKVKFDGPAEEGVGIIAKRMTRVGREGSVQHPVDNLGGAGDGLIKVLRSWRKLLLTVWGMGGGTKVGEMRFVPGSTMISQIVLNTKSTGDEWRYNVFDTICDGGVVEVLVNALRTEGRGEGRDTTCRAFENLSMQLAKGEKGRNQNVDFDDVVSFTSLGGLSRNNSESSLNSLGGAGITDSCSTSIEAILNALLSEMNRTVIQLETCASKRVLYSQACAESSCKNILGEHCAKWGRKGGVWRGDSKVIGCGRGGKIENCTRGMGVSLWLEIVNGGFEILDKLSGEVEEKKDEEDFPWLKKGKEEDLIQIPLVWGRVRGESRGREKEDHAMGNGDGNKGDHVKSSEFLQSHYPVVSVVKDSKGIWRVEYQVYDSKQQLFRVCRGGDIKSEDGSRVHVCCVCEVEGEDKDRKVKMGVFYDGVEAREDLNGVDLSFLEKDKDKEREQGESDDWVPVSAFNLLSVIMHKQSPSPAVRLALKLCGPRSLNDREVADADSYFFRLVSLLLTVCRSSLCFTTTVINNSSSYVPLLLRSLPVTGAGCRRASARLLKIILVAGNVSLMSVERERLFMGGDLDAGNVTDTSTNQEPNNNEEGKSSRFQTPTRANQSPLTSPLTSPAVGSGAKAVAQRREGLKSIAEYLCQLIGLAECAFVVAKVRGESSSILAGLKGGLKTNLLGGNEGEICKGLVCSDVGGVGFVLAATLAQDLEAGEGNGREKNDKHEEKSESLPESMERNPNRWSNKAGRNASSLVRDLTSLTRTLLRDGGEGWKSAISKVLRSGLYKISTIAGSGVHQDTVEMCRVVGPSLTAFNVINGFGSGLEVGSSVFVEEGSKVYDPEVAVGVANGTSKEEEEDWISVTDKIYRAKIVWIGGEEDGEEEGRVVAILEEDEEDKYRESIIAKPLAVVLKCAEVRLKLDGYHESFHHSGTARGSIIASGMEDIIGNVVDAVWKLFDVMPSVHLGEGSDSTSEDDMDLPDLRARCDAALVKSRVRAEGIRCLGVILENPGYARDFIRKGMVGGLVKLASTDVGVSVQLALGGDAGGGKAGDKQALRSLMNIMTTQSLSNSSVRTFSSYLWERMFLASPVQRILGGCKDSAKTRFRKWHEGKVRTVVGNRLEIKPLGGKISREMGKWHVEATSHFPTLQLSGMTVGVRQPTISGMWYYEVTLESDGLMQIGWCGGKFECDPLRGQGVGDHVRSWAFDGLRKKKWNVTSEVYGRRWRAGDVVGSMLDVGRREIRFWLNGQDLGRAFENVPIAERDGLDGEVEGLRPAASLNTGQKAFFNFGHVPFQYLPDPSTFLPAGIGGDEIVRAVGEGVLYSGSYPNSGSKHHVAGSAGRGGGRDPCPEQTKSLIFDPSDMPLTSSIGVPELGSVDVEDFKEEVGSSVINEVFVRGVYVDLEALGGTERGSSNEQAAS